MNTYNLNIYQGDSFSTGVNINDNAGVPMNLSGYLARGTMRLNYSSSGIKDFNCVFSNASSGMLTLSLTSTETSLLPSTQLIYDIEAYTTGDSDVFKVLRGYVNVYPEITHV